MDSFLERIAEQISAYEIFNHIVPGAVYIILADRLTAFSFLTGRVLPDIIIFYFAGVVIGRIGSLLIEKALSHKGKKTGKTFLERAPYSDYLKAEKKDTEHKLNQLLTANNMYRSLASAAVFLLLSVLADWLLPVLPGGTIPRRIFILIVCVLLVLLFLFSLRKQTGYIAKRVQHMTKDEMDENKK